jgi:hypothetical protein
VAKPFFAIPEALSLVQKANGVSILAHPEEWVSEEVVAHFASLGLGGIEVYSPAISSHRKETLALWAKKYGLALSGGSDYHGQRKPEVALGSQGLTAQELKALEDGRMQL